MHVSPREVQAVVFLVCVRDETREEGMVGLGWMDGWMDEWMGRVGAHRGVGLERVLVVDGLEIIRRGTTGQSGRGKCGGSEGDDEHHGGAVL
jgi:hypothetical protein